MRRTLFTISSWMRTPAEAMWKVAATLMALALLAVNFQPAAAVTAGATITVNSTGDAVGNDGVCTLREAINAANTNSPSSDSTGGCTAGTTALDTITFDIGVFNSNKTITASSDLPIITAPLTITGDAPWFNNSSQIKVKGPGGSNSTGFTFQFGSAGSTLNRLSVDGWNVGVGVFAGGVRITNNRIGVDLSGNTADANADGIWIFSSKNVIGGLDASGSPQGNVISGNTTAGVYLALGSNNVIQSNRIGTDVTGFSNLANGAGVYLSAGVAGTLIGGTAAGQGNVIGGSTSGVDIESGAKSTKIVGNYIGLGANGTADVPNTDGIYDTGGLDTLVGGSMPQASNFFGSNLYGIQLNETGGAGTITISGNIIGRDVTDNPAPNVEGIHFSKAPGKANIKGNLISSNNKGIEFGNLTPAASVSQNCISGNTTGADNSGGNVNVAGNWWGSASGPTPPGSGDPVSGPLSVTPWLTKPPSACLGYSPKSVIPKDQYFSNKKTTPTAVSWSGVPTASNYVWNLLRNGSPITTTDVSTPSVSAGVLGYGLYQWYLYVQAGNNVSWPTPQYTFYVTIQKSPKPEAVVVLDSSGGITFSWYAYPGATTYTLFSYTSSDCTSGGVGDHGLFSTSYTPGRIWSSGQHSWQVQALDGALNPIMPCWSFTVP